MTKLWLLNQRLEIFTRLGNEHGIAGILSGMATIYERKGEYDKGYRVLNQSLEKSKQVGDEKGIATTLSIMANIIGERGEYKEAMGTG